MNKIYFTTIATLLLFVGCRRYSEAESTFSPLDNLTLAIDLSEQTRGELAISEDIMGSIGIFCAHTKDKEWADDTDFDKIDNQRLDYNSTSNEWLWYGTAPTWGYDSVVDLYSFVGYSPYAEDTSIISPRVESGELVVEYTLPSDYSSQPDLMMAIPRRDIYPQLSGEVTLDFRHTLAAIGFSVRGIESQVITGISLKGVVSSGEVTLSESGTVEWELGDRSQVSYSAGINDEVTPNTSTTESLTLDDGYLMMIPQKCDSVELEVTIYNSESRNYSTKSYSLESEGEWEAGRVYTYTINISDYDYTIEGTSNCYMLHPNGTTQEFYIPVEGRINTFWRDYADESGAYEDMLSSSDEWEASLLWCDFNGNTNRFQVERVTSGFGSNESVTPLCEPNFTTPGARSAMKITLPSNIDEANFLVAVTFGGKILWSWHLWVTEYNPDLIAAGNSAIDGVYIYTLSGVEGEVHRYDTADLWATLYNDRFIMDRNLGARDCDYSSNRDGVLHYQFGRKEPFPANSSISPDIVNDCVSFAEAVENPTSFYIRRGEPFSWNLESLTMGSSYLWFDKSVANDPNSSGKSIFDPSPLGWRVPRYGTFTVMNTDNCTYYSNQRLVLYNGEIKLPMTGYRSNYSGDINDYGSQGNLRVSTQINSSSGYNFVYNPNVDPDTNNTLSDGFCIRCIEE